MSARIFFEHFSEQGSHLHTLMKPILSLAAAVLICLPQVAFAQDNCTINIRAGDSLKFDVREMFVPASCKQFTVRLIHTGQLPKAATGHNWVLTAAQDVDGVARDGFRAGAVNEWVKPDDKRIIARTAIVGRDEIGEVTFDVDKLDVNAEYGFLCTVGGHSPRMRGTLRVVAPDAASPGPDKTSGH